MILNKQLWRHLIFWLVYLIVNIYNELFLSSSFTNNPSFNYILLAVISQLLTLTVKIPLVYLVLYMLIPRWFSHIHKTRVIFEGVILFLIAAVLHRLIIQLVVWVYVYQSSPTVLTIPQQAARLFYSLLDLLQVTGIAAAIRLFRMRISAIKKERSLVQEKLQAEMLHLKSQINPHFLFNSLNTIFSLTRTKSDDAPDSVLRLSNILRYMIYETNQKSAAIGEELKIINDYIDLQKLRFGERAMVTLNKEIDQDSTRIAPLLILPLVENAFKHGISSTSSVSGIRIDIKVVKHKFLFTIANPVSLQPPSSQSEEGIGLANIQRQLELLYHDYSFSYGKENELFVVNLSINLNSYAGFELFDRRR